MGPTAWKLLGTAAAVAAGSVANKVVSGVWEKAAGKPAPNDPLNTDDVSWKEALLFAALSGLVIQLTRVAAQRKAAQMYQKRAGHLPKAIADRI
ncbi:DUF4235 domain-containing protein [Lapillicoccus jejuensis]|uniref:Uncharacterized protein DUF4235 n=1 Tax=Lapillicoccus jejuensis TaxID=402171 RepID=A0A542DZS9_9MICO|nr:DUF4235 domain-containing protein [Lapillicoccus jejuensis]TQJ08595.1 uncharacterized protein DUF4235 [Lapillicoccus jejuensis]